MNDFDEFDDDEVIEITEKGAIIAQAAEKLLGYGLTARQILEAFGIDVSEETDEDTEKMLGITMFVARHYGVV